MFKFFSRRRDAKRHQESIYQAGREAGTAMYAAIDGYLTPRLAELSGNVLTLLAERFASIYGQPEHDPKLIAQIELEIFYEQLETCPARLKGELEQNCGEWLALASELGVRELLDQRIESQINDAVAELRLAGLESFTQAVDAISDAKPPPT